MGLILHVQSGVEKLLAAPTVFSSTSRILGANDKLVMGIIGTGNRGLGIMKKDIHKNLGVEFKGICDIYRPNLYKANWTLCYTNVLDRSWNIQFLGRNGTLWLDNWGATQRVSAAWSDCEKARRAFSQQKLI